MDNKNHYDLLKEFLDRQSEKVSKNTSIQVKSENVPFMLHISRNPLIKGFTPTIGFRQAKTEDRTVPRVCVAETVVGCMIGYASMLYDFQTNVDPAKKDWRGGYYIYAIDYEAALVPNNKLVYDAAMSGERWLVNYTQGTNVYKHRVIGKMFIRNVVTERKENINHIDCNIYLETREAIWLNAHQKLEPGFYILTGPIPDQVKNYKAKSYQIKTIDKSEFESVRKLTVSLLDIEQCRTLDW